MISEEIFWFSQTSWVIVALYMFWRNNALLKRNSYLELQQANWIVREEVRRIWPDIDEKLYGASDHKGTVMEGQQADVSCGIVK